MARTSKYEVKKWVQSLYLAGVRDYYHNALPDKFKNHAYHMRAIYAGYIFPTGNVVRENIQEWHIRDDIMSLRM